MEFESEIPALSCYFNAGLFYWMLEMFCIFTIQYSSHYTHVNVKHLTVANAT